MKRNYSDLPIEEQIGKLKKEIKFYFIFSIIWSVFIIALSVVLIVCTPLWEFGVAFLCVLPISIGLGGVFQTKIVKEEIKKLEEQKINCQNAQNERNERS